MIAQNYRMLTICRCVPFETKESFYGYKNQSNNYHHLNSHPENIDAIIVEFMICNVHYRVDMEVVNSEI